MTDIKTIMSWLEGLAEPDWRMFHSDSEVQTIAKETLAQLKEQVRCKDCVSFFSNDDAMGATSNRSVMRCPCDCTNPNWFCADGRKKDG